MSGPNINLLYYKALLDRCFCRFFDEFNDQFQNIDGQYVLSQALSISAIRKAFKSYLKDELLKFVRPFDHLAPQYYLVIGAGMPKDNLLLKFKDSCFPKRLDEVINADFQLKYLLKEKDIKIDLIRFNSVMIELFDGLFKSTRNVQRMLGSNMTNVLFIQHKNLDCYSMFKVLKFLFGKSNCTNLYLEQKQFSDSKQPLVAVNDLIDRYVQNKVAMNRSSEFKVIVEEVKDFIGQKMQEIQDGKCR